MMVQKPDWTTQLGQAFTNDKKAVFGSIQRLRLKAQVGRKSQDDSRAASRDPDNIERPAGDRHPADESAGGLRTAVQPANGVRYAACSSALGRVVGVAAAVGFTAGIIIGANSNNHYYGPYGWHGAAMYNEAWEDRYDYLEDRQENRLEYREDRAGESFQENAPQRQANQAERQSTAQANQAERKSTATDESEPSDSPPRRRIRPSDSPVRRTSRHRPRRIAANGKRVPPLRKVTRSASNLSEAVAAATSSYGGQTASQRSSGAALRVTAGKPHLSEALLPPLRVTAGKPHHSEAGRTLAGVTSLEVLHGQKVPGGAAACRLAAAGGGGRRR